MQKVLIADASEPWRELLERALGCGYQVRTCCDGLRTLELIECYEPDLVVMDLMLSGADGLSILKVLEERPVRPKIIVTGRYFSNFITASLERCQVDDALLKPCTIQSITDRVAEVLSAGAEESIHSQNPYDCITALLVSLGAPTSQQGFRFLRSGVLLLLQEPSQQLTKELYPAIAREHHTSAVNVEKSMRTTVTAAWSNRREEVWRSYFPVTSTGQVPKPTAGQFLAHLTNAVRHTQRNRA